MTPSQALSWLCVVFVLGVAVESLVKIPQMLLWGILFLALVIISVSFARTYLLVVGLSLLFLLLGVLRLHAAELRFDQDDLRPFNDASQTVAFKGTVIAEPDIKDGLQKLKVKVENSHSVVLVTTGRHPEYRYLDNIKIVGHLMTPPEFENFSYKNYLEKDGIYSILDFPKVELLSIVHTHSTFSFLYEKILFTKRTLVTSLQTTFPPGEFSILEGVIFGNDSNMSSGLKDQFNKLGLSHITAVSGGNIVIVISILVPLLLFLGLWRTQAFYVSLVFIWVYIALVGFPASGIRAGIMGSLFLCSQKLGRQNTSSRTIVFAGAIMLLQNPWLLMRDVGFQLSFLASLGIIHGKPVIDALLFSEKGGSKGFLKGKLRYIKDMLSVTLAAQIFTLPLIVYYFGTVSFIAPVTNLLILPIVPFLMVFGFLASILGLFSPFLAWISALPCYMLLFYMSKVFDIFYQAWAFKDLETFPLWWCLICYTAIALATWLLGRTSKPFFEY